MNAILKGDYFPWEPKYVNTPKISELNKKIEQELEHFEKDMAQADRYRFDELFCLVTERSSEENDEL